MEQSITTAIAAAKTCLEEQSKSCPSLELKVTNLRNLCPSYEQFCLTYNPVCQVSYGADERSALMQDSSAVSILDAAYGSGSSASWLAEHIGELNTFSGSKNMDDEQVKDLARMIAAEYKDMKLSEIMLFFYRFKMGRFGKFYGKADPMVITCALKDFKIEIFKQKQEFINQEYEENEARIKQKREEERQLWYDCQEALIKSATSEEMRKIFQSIDYEGEYEEDGKTILVLNVYPEEYAFIEGRSMEVFSPVFRHFYPTVTLNYRMREHKPSKEDKEKEKLQKQISETLTSARRLIANEQGWDNDTVEMAKYGFKLKYKLTPEEYVAKFGESVSKE